MERRMKSVWAVVLGLAIGYAAIAIAASGNPEKQATASKNYQLSHTVEKSITGGSVVLNVAVSSGYKINKEFPLKLTATGPEGVTIEKASQAGKDATKMTEHLLIMTVPYKLADSSKPANMDLALRFGICKIEKGKVSLCTFHNEKLSANLVEVNTESEKAKTGQEPADPSTK